MSSENALYNPIFNDAWEQFSLHELAGWKNGIAFKNNYFCNEGKPVIKIAELKNGISDQTKYSDQTFDSAYYLTKKDLLFSWSGSPETSIDVFWYDLPDGWLNQHIFKVTPFDKVTKDYMFYVLKYLKPIFIEIAKNKQTTGLGHVTMTDLKNILVRIPKNNEQRAIAATLSALDDKIELNNRINKTLEEMAQALFKRWFVDFEFPDENGQPYKSSGGEMEESELGLIPKGWTIVTLREISEKISKGTTPTNKEISQAEDQCSIYFMKVKDISDTGCINVADMERIPLSIHEGILKRSILQTDDVLVSIAGTIGRVAILPPELSNSNSNQAIAFIRLKCGYHIIGEFVRLLLRTDRVQNTFQSRIVQGVQPNLSLTEIGNLKFALPNKSVIDVWNEIGISIGSYRRFNEQEITNLSALRDALLPKLMSGEIRVPIEEVAADV